MELTKILILAMISEALWETLKMTWQNGKISTDRVGAMVTGLILCLATGMDIIQAVGIPMKIPVLGQILTGLLISRGANFIHDILASAGNINCNTKPIIKSEEKSSLHK